MHFLFSCRPLNQARKGKQLMSMTTFHTSTLVPLSCPGNSMVTMLVSRCSLGTVIQKHQSQSLDHTGSKTERLLEHFWKVEVLMKTRLLLKLRESSLQFRIWISSQRKVFPLPVTFDYFLAQHLPMSLRCGTAACFSISIL